MNPWIEKSKEIDGWLFEGEPEFLWELASRSQSGDILEIGTWQGKSACVLAGNCIDLAPDTKLICVDTFRMNGTHSQRDIHRDSFPNQPGTFYKFCDNSEKYGLDSKLLVVTGLSAIVIPQLKTELRMAFIDGQHDYENVKRDVELCIPLLKEGGIIALHDVVGDAWPDLKRYVDAEMSQRNDLEFIGTRGTISAFAKVEPKMCLVIARNNEDAEWMCNYPGIKILVQKGMHVENAGREASSYLHFIIKNYDSLDGDYIFCQGNPFDHCPNFLQDVKNKSVFGNIWECDGNGKALDLPERTHMLPVSQTALQLGLEPQERYTFVSSAQFKVSAECIKRRPLEFYKKAFEFSIYDRQSAWILERLWFVIFQEPRL